MFVRLLYFITRAWKILPKKRKKPPKSVGPWDGLFAGITY